MIDSRQYEYLKAMGISVWQHRDQVVESGGEALAPSPLPTSGVEIAASGKVASLDWDALEASVRSCQLCELHRSRTQVVFGTGNRAADLMIIGEAPGADEDRQGEPFVGRAGQLLNAMLQAIGLQRQQVYIANILKCRPPNNRDPSPEESNLCQDYLFRQIELIQPKLILVLGRIAAHRLLQTDTPLSKLRGQFHVEPHTGTPLLITYHPAYLLRSPKEKRKAWQDLLSTKQRLQQASGR